MFEWYFCSSSAKWLIHSVNSYVWFVVLPYFLNDYVYSKFISPMQPVPGDVLVLTKPLGTQMALTLHKWKEDPETWEKLKNTVSAEDVDIAYNVAFESIIRTNRSSSFF